jgi:hypothetical protein
MAQQWNLLHSGDRSPAGVTAYERGSRLVLCGWLAGGYALATNGSKLVAFIGNENLSLGTHLIEVFSDPESQPVRPTIHR